MQWEGRRVGPSCLRAAPSSHLHLNCPTSPSPPPPHHQPALQCRHVCVERRLPLPAGLQAGKSLREGKGGTGGSGGQGGQREERGVRWQSFSTSPPPPPACRNGADVSCGYSIRTLPSSAPPPSTCSLGPHLLQHPPAPSPLVSLPTCSFCSSSALRSLSFATAPSFHLGTHAYTNTGC